MCALTQFVAILAVVLFSVYKCYVVAVILNQRPWCKWWCFDRIGVRRNMVYIQLSHSAFLNAFGLLRAVHGQVMQTQNKTKWQLSHGWTKTTLLIRSCATFCWRSFVVVLIQNSRPFTQEVKLTGLIMQIDQSDLYSSIFEFADHLRRIGRLDSPSAWWLHFDEQVQFCSYYFVMFLMTHSLFFFLIFLLRCLIM